MRWIVIEAATRMGALEGVARLLQASGTMTPRVGEQPADRREQGALAGVTFDRGDDRPTASTRDHPTVRASSRERDWTRGRGRASCVAPTLRRHTTRCAIRRKRAALAVTTADASAVRDRTSTCIVRRPTAAQRLDYPSCTPLARTSTCAFGCSECVASEIRLSPPAAVRRARHGDRRTACDFSDVSTGAPPPRLRRGEAGNLCRSQSTIRSRRRSTCTNGQALRRRQRLLVVARPTRYRRNAGATAAGRRARARRRRHGPRCLPRRDDRRGRDDVQENVPQERRDELRQRESCETTFEPVGVCR